MKYNVILEGCDCVGKTSIADLFVRDGFNRLKCSAPKDKFDAIEQYARTARELQTSKGNVLDRFMLGECVYGPVMRGYDTGSVIHEMEKHLPEDTLLVLVYAEPDTVKKRFDGVFITEDQIPEILDRFKDEWIDSQVPNKILVDTTHKTPEEAYADIVKYARWKGW